MLSVALSTQAAYYRSDKERIRQSFVYWWMVYYVARSMEVRWALCYRHHQRTNEYLTSVGGNLYVYGTHSNR